MNEYYDFYKDFAGVTELDLEQFKKGGKACKASCGKKMKKLEDGKKIKPDTDNESMMVGEKADPNYLKMKLEQLNKLNNKLNTSSNWFKSSYNNLKTNVKNKINSRVKKLGK